MKRLREPHWALILLFAGLIGLVPLFQTAREALQEDGVQAVNLFGQAPTAANLRAFEQSLEKTSWAARLSRPWLQTLQFSWLRYGGDKVIEGADGWYFFKPGLQYMLARHEPSPASDATNDPVAAILHFRNQLAAQGIQLLVMPVPNKESIYPDLLTTRAASLRGVVAPRTRETLDKLRAANVEIVDLFREFHLARNAAAGETSAPLYLAQDTHWSPAGVSLAAKAAARRLISLGWVQPGTTGYEERPAPVKRIGDILRMMQVPAIERSIPPESVAAVQIVKSDGGEPYGDAAEADILVLGDSFMRIYQQDEPNSGGFIAHLAKELKQPILSLVNDGGGSTLVREELSSRPIFLRNKKVVLWEFVERDIGIGIKGWQRVPVPPAPAPSAQDAKS